MAEIIATIDPEAIAEIRRIRELLEKRLAPEALVDVFLDAFNRNVHGIREIVSKS